MAIDAEDFRLRLLKTFRTEAQDHVQALCSGLIELEQAAAESRMPVLEIMFREVHSLKGAARAVEMTEIEALCHALESFFAALKRREIDLSGELFDLLHQAADLLVSLLSSAPRELAAQVASVKERLALMLGNANSVRWRPVSSGSPSFTEIAPVQEAPPRHAPGAAGTDSGPRVSPSGGTLDVIKIPSAKLNSILLQAEDFISEKLSGQQRFDELKKMQGRLSAWQREWRKVHPDLASLRSAPDRHPSQGEGVPWGTKLSRVLEFLEQSKSLVAALEDDLKALAKSGQQENRSLAGKVDTLLSHLKDALLLPFSSLFEPFPKLVRDLARAQGKDVELEIIGEQIEIDRRILEGLKEPLIHLVRNALDHGIETAQLRQREGKSPKGKLTLRISRQDGGKVEITVSDDGTGVDLSKVKETALEHGVLSGDGHACGEQQVLACIFESGISTSPIITDLSGRGLGLAIVREKVEKLGGAVFVESRPGRGTRFRLLVPMTHATFRGVVVRAFDQPLVVPANNVLHVLRISRDEIKTVEGLESVMVAGKAVSLVGLGEVLELNSRNLLTFPSARIQVVVLGSAGTSIAFRVEEVIGEQEILVKNLGPQLVRVRNIGGAAFLGTGKMVPVLNVPDLLRSAVKRAAVPTRNMTPAALDNRNPPSILVVEDSITSRMLLKNILEAAGYRVETAVDGMDGLTRAKSSSFAVVISDVDMPRMNGFDLTARIRGDRKLAELPVVLVTSLESREDKERGIEVGANAYIVKSDFDQSNLLETVQRLI